MNRKTATMVGAAAALATTPALGGQAVAREAPVPVAMTYADLLKPIPNAVERLQLADAEDQAAPPRLIPAQYNAHHHHHHHHHHHSRRWYLTHGYIWSGGAWIIRPVDPHHHHHNNY